MILLFVVAAKKSSIKGSIKVKFQDVDVFVGASNSATPKSGYGNQGTNLTKSAFNC